MLEGGFGGGFSLLTCDVMVFVPWGVGYRIRGLGVRFELGEKVMLWDALIFWSVPLRMCCVGVLMVFR